MPELILLESSAAIKRVRGEARSEGGCVSSLQRRSNTPSAQLPAIPVSAVTRRLCARRQLVLYNPSLPPCTTPNTGPSVEEERRI